MTYTKISSKAGSNWRRIPGAAVLQSLHQRLEGIIGHSGQRPKDKTMIVVEALKTRRHLRELCVDVAERIEADNLPDGVHADAQYLADCLDRFNIWAGTLGVFQRGDASLDSRLSNRSLVREVFRLLKQVDLFSSARK